MNPGDDEAGGSTPAVSVANAGDGTRATGGRRGALALVGLAGLGAAAAGVAWRWRQDAAAVTAQAPDTGAAEPLWARRFEQPGGQTLDMATLRGRPLVLNFWATWCPPCIEELPEIDQFFKRWSARGWQVVGLAVDSPTPVREFLARRPLAFPVGLAALEGTALSRSLGNAQGALPFTAVFDRQGALKHRKLGRTSLSELEAWATTV